MNTFVVALLLPVALALLGQQVQFTTTTSLVRLEVNVLDRAGTITGLRATDFVVLDRGVPQSVQVEESSDAALDLVLVAQPFASVAYISPEQVSRVAAGVAAFLNQVRDHDRLGAFLASTPPTRLRPLEFGPASLDMKTFSGGTFAAPFDSIAAGLREFVESDRRRALIVFTNAADFRSTISFEALAEMTRRLGPTLVLIGTAVKIQEGFGAAAQDGSSGRQIGDAVMGVASGYVFPARLQLLAKRTGGIAINLSSGDPMEMMKQMFAWLRTTYTISYKPPEGKGWHPVTVKVNRRDAKVSVRDGYFID